MLFSLDKPQAFPVDVWIVKAMRDWYPDAPVPPALNSNGNKTTPTERHKREMREWALERFGGACGVREPVYVSPQAVGGSRERFRIGGCG